MANFKLDYTGSQINTGIQKSIDRCYISVAKDSEVATTQTFSAGEVDTYKVMPFDLDLIGANKFEINSGGLKYLGTSPLKLAFNGVCTLGCSVLNTVVHLRLAINDSPIPYTTSAVKLSSNTDLTTANAACIINVAQNDILKVYVSADKASTVSAYHPQLTLIEI
jgi:hypothetical protein